MIYTYSHLLDYYPSSMKDCSAKQTENRETVRNFMKGGISAELLQHIAIKANDLVRENEIDVACFIPGTSGSQTVLRFGEIAEHLSSILPCSVYLDGVTLQYDTDLITHIRSFQCNEKRFSGKRVLLIGDIYTSGASLQETGDLLIQNGAKSVYGFYVAKVIQAGKDIEI